MVINPGLALIVVRTTRPSPLPIHKVCPFRIYLLYMKLAARNILTK